VHLAELESEGDTGWQPRPRTSTSCAKRRGGATPTGTPTSPSASARYATRSRSPSCASRGRSPRSLADTLGADTLGISQGNVSRLETRSDVYLSTLRSYVEALGGHLEIAAVFGDERVGVAVGPSQPPNTD